MKRLFLPLLLAAIPGGALQCQSSKFPLQPQMEHSQFQRWLAKPVSDSLLIEDFESPTLQWYSEGIGKVEVVSDNSIDGQHSLRYRTSMRDTAHIASPRQRTQWGSFGGEQGGENRFGIRFAEPQDWSAYNRISVWVYVHPDRNRHHHFFLYVENEGTDYSYPLEPRHDHCVQNLKEGEWQQIVWEIDYLERSKIREFRIFQTLVGFEPDGDEFVTFDFDRLQLQQVVPDHYDGYQIPEGGFAFSHIGYRPSDDKVALTALLGQEREFALLDEADNVVFSAPVVPVENRNGCFAQLDFSKFQLPGTYRLRYGKSESKSFPIGADVWQVPFEAGLNYYYCQQCGVAVEGYHDVCHQDWYGFRGDEKLLMNGGFHDAGDLSQGYFRTALAAYILLRNLGGDHPDEQTTALARHAVDWIMKTRFSDGYHISWARQRIWSDNQEGTIDDVMIRATNPAWENFLGAAVLAMASERIAGLSEKERQDLRAAAEDNWQQAYSSRSEWNRSSDNEASWGAISSVALWKLTQDERYKQAAQRFGNLLVACQEQHFIPGTSITGYFYSDQSHERIIQNNHGAFYESPMVALRTLCDALPDAPDWFDWYAAASIYADCFLKPGAAYAAPFNLLPNAVYRLADLNNVRNERNRRSSLEQYRQGWQLNDEYALRTFPIWGGDLFHGATCCNLSTAWALAEASQLRKDRDGLTLAKEQLEWTLGRNPFEQSLMYGVGYNYATQFVYCSKDMVGGLPVGMDSFKDDAPYWHGSNYATSKETWIGTVNRFMGALTAFRDSSSSEITANLELRQQRNGSFRFVIESEGNHVVSVRAWNSKDLSFTNTKFRNGKASPLLKVKAKDNGKPVVVLLLLDGKPLYEFLLKPMAFKAFPR